MNSLWYTLWFCPCCFASSENGSWNHTAYEGGCSNCGAGPSIQLPPWAIDSIRQQASWVGKRYYPHAEDQEHSREVRALRSIVKEFPGRTACENVANPGWSVTQVMPDGSKCSMYFFNAKSEAEALALARLELPYVPSTAELKFGKAEFEQLKAVEDPIPDLYDPADDDL